MHYLHQHALCSVLSAAFRATLPIRMPSALFRRGSLLSTHRCHHWRVWRFRRPQSRRSLGHRRTSRLSIVHSLLQTVILPAVHLFRGGSVNAATTPTTPTYFESRLGPKSEISRHVLRPRCGFFARIYLQLLCTTHILMSADGVRVSIGVATMEGATTQMTQSSSHVLAKHSDATDIHAPPFNFARKRAYRRAIGSARTHGSTTYRGHVLSLQQLTGQRHNNSGIQLSRTSRPSATAPSTRLLCWNVGGLSNAVLDELYCWLDQPANRVYKIVMIQETHWTFSSEWVSGRWSLLHSGSTKHKGGGLLTLIDKDLCPTASLRTQEIHPGRIQHVRVPLDSGISVDLLNVYQYARDARAPPIEQTALLEAARDGRSRSTPAQSLSLCR